MCAQAVKPRLNVAAAELNSVEEEEEEEEEEEACRGSM
jgi:hypothetical protein